MRLKDKNKDKNQNENYNKSQLLFEPLYAHSDFEMETLKPVIIQIMSYVCKRKQQIPPINIKH